MMTVFMDEVFRCPVCNSTFFGSYRHQDTGKLIRSCHGMIKKIIGYSGDEGISIVAEQCKHTWNEDNDDRFRVVEFKNTTQEMRNKLKKLYIEMLRDEA